MIFFLVEDVLRWFLVVDLCGVFGSSAVLGNVSVGE